MVTKCFIDCFLCSLFKVTWSKIIALFAFGHRLAQHCRERRLGADLEAEVAENLAQVAVRRITPFLREHGGWVRE